MIDRLLIPRNILFVSIFYLTILSLSYVIYAGSSWSPDGYFSVYGYDYSNRSYISTTTGSYNGYTYISCSNKQVPAGYMGAQSRIYNSSNDALVSYSSMAYSGSTLWSFGSDSVYNSITSGSYYSKGLTKVYNGDGYGSYSTFQSPSQTVN